MAGSFELFEKQEVRTSNHCFSALVHWALELAQELHPEHPFVAEYASKIDVWDAVTYLEIHEEFTLEQAQFWSPIFEGVAQKIFLCERGNAGNLTWQTWYIYCAMSVHSMLDEYVRILKKNSPE